MKNAFVVFFLALLLALGHATITKADSKLFQEDAERAVDMKQARQLGKDIKAGKLAERLDKALDNLILSSVSELNKRGEKQLAKEIKSDWENKYKGFIFEIERGVYKNPGDHPAIPWLLSIHDKIHNVVGDAICRAVRFHDLWYLAYCIPVVFKCVDNVGAFEYERHFVPLVKIISYWLTYGVCVGVSMGTGVIGFCGLIGMGVETLCGTFVAPLLVDGAYRHFCASQIVPVGGAWE